METRGATAAWVPGRSLLERLVELLGGQVRVRSAVGQGATFTPTPPASLPADAMRAPADHPLQ